MENWDSPTNSMILFGRAKLKWVCWSNIPKDAHFVFRTEPDKVFKKTDRFSYHDGRLLHFPSSLNPDFARVEPVTAYIAFDGTIREN